MPDVNIARLAVWEAAYAVDAAIRCAERAVKVPGGYGMAEEFPVAKLLRDAWTGWSCDFTGDMLLLDVARQL